jgi:excinuclease UvrABC nuclease subunit
MDGIGKLTAAKLLKAFETVAQLKEASEEDLAKVLGKMKALKFKKQLENL